MRALRKTKKCLNCQFTLSDVYDYCPMCGQQNDDKNVSFKDLTRDLVENFFSFDSRLAHSVVPFFFQPGRLTTAYNEGKRFSYANPIRMYIIVSVFYFFIISLIAGDASRKLDDSLASSDSDSLRMSIITEIMDEPDTTQSQSHEHSNVDELSPNVGPLSGNKLLVSEKKVGYFFHLRKIQ